MGKECDSSACLIPQGFVLSCVMAPSSADWVSLQMSSTSCLLHGPALKHLAPA